MDTDVGAEVGLGFSQGRWEVVAAAMMNMDQPSTIRINSTKRQADDVCPTECGMIGTSREDRYENIRDLESSYKADVRSGPWFRR